MAQGKTDNLEAFAKRIETRIRNSRGSNDGMEQLICRLLVGKDPNIATRLAEKWVEWRYGKPKQSVEVAGTDGERIKVEVAFCQPQQ